MASRQVSQEMIFICLKFGITHQSVQIDKSNPNILSELNQNAKDIVSKALKDLEGDIDQYQIKLFLISPDHQPASLKLITRPSDLTPACFIEIIIWRSDQPSFAIAKDHVLAEHSYKKPTYCSSCDYFMWGLVKQGKRCRLCRRDFHHQCAEHLPADCPGTDSRSSRLGRRVSSTTTLSSMTPGQTYVDADLSNGAQTTSKKSRIGKLFTSSPKNSSSSLTNGRSSNASSISTMSSLMVPGSSRVAGLINSDRSPAPSGKNSHHAVTPTIGSSNNHRTNRLPSESTTPVMPVRPPPPPPPPQITVKPDRRKDIKLTNCQEKDGVWTATGQFGRESRHSKRTDISYDEKKFKFTQKDDQGRKQVVEIPASDVEARRKQPGFSDSSSSLDSSTGSPATEAMVYEKLACLLLETIKEADRERMNGKPRSSFKMVRGKENHSKDFSDLYEINEKDILGKGRFGIVFGGVMRRNGFRVAIKKIQTSQCTQKERENIEQEATFLFQLNHPGILKFEGIFDFEQHVVLVTERLETDMLNYILSNTNPPARLTEDVTRFLAFQLVAAIRYLHFKNIAHCDLKPDNILINIFPEGIVHLKVGDFGYARTIHEHSLRYTKVGTTAYLPPEVSHDQWRHARGYNKTVDMWAIGVVIFVSLTGFFPFHEELDILPQLENIHKLFQDDIFSRATEEVRDLLKFRLLVPDAGHRMHSAGVIYHDWFQKSQTLLVACRGLEKCLEKKWLTLFFEEPETSSSIPIIQTDDSDSS